jgi:hypothetical protein
MQEAPGILNWLIEGVLDYLANGLVIAPRIGKLTQEQIEEMDPIAQFCRDCIEPDHSGRGSRRARCITPTAHGRYARQPCPALPPLQWHQVRPAGLLNS